jgi:precorrin-2 dehydrogenase/sirohydrochlorin ferrochelatase
MQIKSREVLVVGGGELAERKVENILPYNPNITIISKTFTPKLRSLQKEGKIRLIEGDPLKDPSLLDRLEEATLVYAATDDKKVNSYVSEMARKNKVLVCAVDMPDLCDFYTPASFRRGPISVGISTDGKSPLMARVLTNRLEKLVTNDDSLQVTLQHHVRQILKERIREQLTRREILYEIYNEEGISKLLAQNHFEAAKKQAEKLIEDSIKRE